MNIFPQKETFCSKITLQSMPSRSAIIGNSPRERIGLVKTMLNRSGINVISYDMSHTARFHPACTLPCSKIVDHIYCPESERIRGAKINIWCPTLLSPVPGTTLSWPTPKNINTSLEWSKIFSDIQRVWMLFGLKHLVIDYQSFQKFSERWSLFNQAMDEKKMYIRYV